VSRPLSAATIDEVRVFSGVLSDPAIAAESGRTDPRPPSLFAGAFERYVAHDSQHYVGPGPVPPGYHLEGPLGFAAPAGAPNTRMIWSCRNSGGQFLSQVATCENYEVLGQAGLMYTAPPAGVSTAAVYRCVVLATSDHLASFDPNCESTPDKVSMEFPLGYTRLLAPLVRYLGPDGEHWSSSHGQLLPGGYTPEARLGLVSMSETGSAPLRVCRQSTDEFLSLDPGCEGGQEVTAWSSGGVWPSPPAGVAESAPLYACRSNPTSQFPSGGAVRVAGSVL
jgi:hypothetical protein